MPGRSGTRRSRTCSPPRPLPPSSSSRTSPPDGSPTSCASRGGRIHREAHAPRRTRPDILAAAAVIEITSRRLSLDLPAHESSATIRPARQSATRSRKQTRRSSTMSSSSSANSSRTRHPRLLGATPRSRSCPPAPSASRSTITTRHFQNCGCPIFQVI